MYGIRQAELPLRHSRVAAKPRPICAVLAPYLPSAKIVGKCRSPHGAQASSALRGDMDLQMRPPEARQSATAPRRRLGAVVALLAAVAVSASVATDVRAQGWWPWANQDARPPRDARPPAPIPNQPPPGGNFPGGQGFPGQPPPQAGRPGASGGNICLQLEQRLVAEGQNRARATHGRRCQARERTARDRSANSGQRPTRPWRLL